MKFITLGRLPENDIVISQTSISRQHARITLDDGKYEIEDLKSKNGVYVNGRKVRGKKEIHPGDRIVLAAIPLTADWVQKLDGKPDNEKEKQKEFIQNLPKQTDNTTEAQEPVAHPEQKKRLDTSMLYDFDKNVEEFFEGGSLNIEKEINTYRETGFCQRKKRPLKNYSEEFFDICQEQYLINCSNLVNFMERMERECSDFDAKYADNMKKLDNTYLRIVANEGSASVVNVSLQDVDEKRETYRKLYQQLKEKTLESLSSVRDDFYAQNPPLFTGRFELALSNSEIWSNLPSNHDKIQSTLYLGEDKLNFKLFGDYFGIAVRSYVHSVCRGNLMFVHNGKTRQTCFDTVNTLICRMLMSVPQGGIRVNMVDFNEMEGTCNSFKDINRNVYRIVSRHDDLMRLLGALSTHVENVIQNLLRGDVNNLSDYNNGKSNKEPYHLLVLKDIPVGYGLESFNMLAEIMRNGPRAGVFVIILVDEDVSNRNEEMRKKYITVCNISKNVSCETVNFVSKEIPDGLSSMHHSVSFDILPKRYIDNVVKRVNVNIEAKTETILHYTEYMLPENEWWMGQSANRVDLPFGISDDMKTTSLHITQESGQNSAVVIGIPGSGKSVFLHTIIASAITHYSQKELQLYLLDFSGVEFDVYARHQLPHARVIAPEAEREFGLSILREVFEEGNRRMTLCRDNGVTNIVELKRNNPEMVVPRLLVIIDEFQKIFEVENDNISNEANVKIHAIIQEYRKFGINLILATQKLPQKSIVPVDLIANRVVFKSDPRDFDNLIHWSRTMPSPRLQTGACIYNDESGAEIANVPTQSFFINASKELEKLLDDVQQFALQHPKMTDTNKLRTFRSEELPLFNKRIISSKHEISPMPKEIGVYVGESIAIAQCHVYVPLTKDSNNNILIIGGHGDVAKGIAYHTLLSEIDAHTEKACNVMLLNFMLDDDPIQEFIHNEMFSYVADYGNVSEKRGPDEVKKCLEIIKKVIDKRKEDSSIQITDWFINIFDFQRGRMFDGVGSRGDHQSECGMLLEYILRNGPLVGVYTILHVDNLTNLNKLCYGAANLFCHRIALQMSDQDSGKVVNNSAANKLLVLNRPATKYRALYYNNINGSMTKFKPYKLC